jgi:hypothetical protein
MWFLKAHKKSSHSPLPLNTGIIYTPTHPTHIKHKILSLYQYIIVCRYTHWKQTLFYFDEPLALVQDDRIEGTIDIRQSNTNKRFLCIDIQFIFNGSLHFKKHFELK